MKAGLQLAEAQAKAQLQVQQEDKLTNAVAGADKKIFSTSRSRGIG